MLGTILSTVQALSFGISIFENIKTVQGVITGNTVTNRLASIEEKLGVLELINENLARSPIEEVTVHEGVTQDFSQIDQLIPPMSRVQSALGCALIQSKPIIAPENVLRIFGENPERLLSNIMKLQGENVPDELFNDPTLVPVVFERWGETFVGWAKEGALTISLNTDYRSIVSDRISGTRSHKLSKDTVKYVDSSIFLQTEIAVYSIDWGYPEKHVTISGNDTEVHVIDFESKKVVKKICEHNGSILMANLSSDKRRILTASTDGTAALWNMGTGEKLLSLPANSELMNSDSWLDRKEAGSIWVTSAKFDQKSEYIFTSDHNGYVKHWNGWDGREIWRFVAHDGRVEAMDVSRDGRRLVTVGSDCQVCVWDISGRSKLANLVGHGSTIRAVKFSPDGQYIVTGSWDETVRLWDVRRAQQIGVLGRGAGLIETVAFSPDGLMVLAGGRDCLARVWDIASGDQVGLLKGHSEAIFCAYFLGPMQIFTGSGDKTVRLWHLD